MATLYFNAAVDENWAELGNWWTNDVFDTQATSLPTSSDSVVILGTCSSNSGSEPTVVDVLVSGGNGLNISITVTGLATFNGVQRNGGTLTGNALFINGAVNSPGDGGHVTGLATFESGAQNDGYVQNAIFDAGTNNAANSQVYGDATFNSTTNSGYVGGTATFNGNAVQGGTAEYAIFNDTSSCEGNGTDVAVNMLATFNDYSYAYTSVILGSCIFNDHSYVTGGYVRIDGTCEFKDDSHVDCDMDNGTYTFNDRSYISPGVTYLGGTFTFNDASLFTTVTIPNATLTRKFGVNGSSILGIV